MELLVMDNFLIKICQFICIPETAKKKDSAWGWFAKRSTWFCLQILCCLYFNYSLIILLLRILQNTTRKPKCQYNFLLVTNRHMWRVVPPSCRHCRRRWSESSPPSPDEGHLDTGTARVSPGDEMTCSRPRPPSGAAADTAALDRQYKNNNGLIRV